MNNDYNDEVRHKMKGQVLKQLVGRYPQNSVIAVTPLYHAENFNELIKQEIILAIELQDTPEHIFDRLVFSDENDIVYKDDEYKNEHKEYYLYDINEDIIFYSDVFKNVELKYFMNNDSPKEVHRGLVKLIKKYLLHKK